MARELLGKILVYDANGRRRAARIVETEGYIGKDPASHARMGPTGRNFPMFGPGGFTYVYLIYGSNHCLNISTESAGIGAAVLIRGAEALEGCGPGVSLSGPGLLCRAFGITTAQTNLDLLSGPITVVDAPALPPRTIGRSKRINVEDARPWRFYVRGSRGVSGPLRLRS